MPDINALEIARSKALANSEKYFGLFDKYVDDDFYNCLLFMLGNEDVILRIIQKNPDANYLIYDTPDVAKILKIINKDYNYHISFCGNDEVKEEELFDMDELKTVKFDKIIMNPPYCKNLHLKILEKAIQHLTDDGDCVNLSPVRWLQDPLAQYKKNSDYHKFEDSVSKHINNTELITAREAQKIFDGTVMSIDLGIYFLTTKKEKFNYESFAISPILYKRIKFFIENHPTIEMNKKDGWRVRMPFIITGKSGGSGNREEGLRSFGKLLYFHNGMKDGKPWYEWYRKNQHSKTTEEITSSIKFNSEIEASNFIKQFDTSFCKYMTNEIISDVHVTEEQILWMGEEINPRTGKKGYESEWTDADFYKFFNITEDEQKIIEKTMEKYK